jgi:hypothetical protein
MPRQRTTWLAAVALVLVSLAWSRAESRPGDTERTKAPKIWDEKQLATWAIPLAGINTAGRHYTEAEYYAAPVLEFRTYPVYHPDREPKGYLDSLEKRAAEPLIELGKARTRAEWIAAGRRVFDEMDIPLVRTDDRRVVEYVRSREGLEKYPQRVNQAGEVMDLRWVVERTGTLKLSVRECGSCHTRLLPDGTVIAGAQGNFRTEPNPMFGLIFGAFNFPREPGGELTSPGEGAYAQFGVPWLEDDVHAQFKTMPPPQILPILLADATSTFARFNGSPYYTTKMPSLIGVRNRRYLDHTGTHRNRGPEDIARYAALVGFADDGSIGTHRFFTDYQRRIRARFSDDALYALGMFIYYGLEEPPNPNKADGLSRAGEKVFASSGCGTCHTAPDYTNNSLIAVDGFKPSKALGTDLTIMEGIRIGTDPGLALRTRKGTGFYKVPSLRGLWHRGLIEHSGSIASLEDWFDAKRLRDDYTPSGWQRPGTKTRAVPGHEFGLSLSPEDKRALIAFLKTL